MTLTIAPANPGSDRNKTDKMKTFAKVNHDKNGYASLVRCGKGHNGNQRLAGPTTGGYQCIGCLTFFSTEYVLDCQRLAKSGQLGGVNGQGGIIAK